MSESNIEFHSEGDFVLSNPHEIKDWFAEAAIKEGKVMGALNFIFCDDTYLHKLNFEFLKHDTYTDIITFDYSVGNELIGDVYISVERVKENAVTFDVTFENELKRVLIHGLLHLCGYKDKTVQEADEMRAKENKYLNIFV